MRFVGCLNLRMKICGDLTETDAAVTRGYFFIDEDTFGEKVFSHDSVVGTTARPHYWFACLRGNSIETASEIVLHSGSEPVFILRYMFDEITKERRGFEYGVFDNGGNIERRCGMSLKKYGWSTIIGSLVAETKESGGGIKNSATAGCQWRVEFFDELFFKKGKFLR